LSLPVFAKFLIHHFLKEYDTPCLKYKTQYMSRRKAYGSINTHYVYKHNLKIGCQCAKCNSIYYVKYSSFNFLRVGKDICLKKKYTARPKSDNEGAETYHDKRMKLRETILNESRQTIQHVVSTQANETSLCSSVKVVSTQDSNIYSAL
jgi:hypothetical protein